MVIRARLTVGARIAIAIAFAMATITRAGTAIGVSSTAIGVKMASGATELYRCDLAPPEALLDISDAIAGPQPPLQAAEVVAEQQQRVVVFGKLPIVSWHIDRIAEISAAIARRVLDDERACACEAEGAPPRAPPHFDELLEAGRVVDSVAVSVLNLRQRGVVSSVERPAFTAPAKCPRPATAIAIAQGVHDLSRPALRTMRPDGNLTATAKQCVEQVVDARSPINIAPLITVDERAVDVEYYGKRDNVRVVLAFTRDHAVPFAIPQFSLVTWQTCAYRGGGRATRGTQG